MNIAIIGYGKMGREIEQIALQRGHNVALIVDVDNRAQLSDGSLNGIDVAIEFTTPATAFENLSACIEAGVPVVSGTTGWLDKFDLITELCNSRGGGFFYASNYSLGVNLMFKMNSLMAKMMNRIDGYKVAIEETHHIHKKDAPSGTAITIAEGIISELEDKNEWVNDIEPADNQINIHSIREGEVPGIHSVTYTAEDDVLELKHTITNRRTLALGAVVAAEFLAGKKGVYSMDDLLK